MELKVRHDELARRDRAQDHTERDAQLHRTDDLYATAVTQLGSPDSVVRLGGH